MPQIQFTPDTRVGDIVVAQPLLAQVFERLGIDFCCGGKRSLADACRAKQVDPATVIEWLETAMRGASAAPAADVSGLSLSALADHIAQTHHLFLQEALPALVEKAERVAAKHAWRDARLSEVAELIYTLTMEMVEHTTKEQRDLFPLLSDLNRSGSERTESVATLIDQLRSTHASAGAALASLRTLTDGFTPDVCACNTHRAMLAGLAQLEVNLHEHMRTENNILFPRALACVASP